MIRSLFCLCHALLFCAVPGFTQNPGLYFPSKTGTTWLGTAPASLGFCPERVDSLYQFLADKHTKSFVLLQDGRIVLEKYFGPYTQDSSWYWASAGKSLTAFLVGQAQDEGLLNIQTATSDYLGAGWTSGTPAQENAITLRHLLSMTSGLDDTPVTSVPDPNLCTNPACLQYLTTPGTRWAYHSGPYRLLQDVIAAASGGTINQFTKTRLLDRIGMKGFWFEDVQYGRARDMARFGLLVQNRGVWDGDTLLHDQPYFDDMIHPSQSLNQGYGYLWWLNGQPSFMLPGLQVVLPGKLIPNAPDDMISALGKNDQKIHVVPSKGWVVVRQGEAAGYTGSGGGQVPIAFDNELWSYLNQLSCAPTATGEVVAGQVQLFPNPTQGQLYWRGLPVGTNVRIRMYDTLGQLRVDQQANDQHLDLGSFTEGLYLVQLFSAENTLLVSQNVVVARR